MAGLPGSRLADLGWRNTNNRIPGGWCLLQFRNSGDPYAATRTRFANGGSVAADGAKLHARWHFGPQAPFFKNLVSITVSLTRENGTLTI
jgi:hypothetical protein